VTVSDTRAPLKVAVAQVTPVVLDRAACVAKACRFIAAAGDRGARLVAFPETWIPGYPVWCDTGTLGRWEHAPAKRIHARLMRASVTIPSPDTDALCTAARRARVAVVMGVSELGAGGGTLYNTLLFITSDGQLAGRHRKLVPTLGERLVWGHGDAAGLRPFDLGAGAQVGGLVCWEHWMPLPRHVLHASGEEVHVAAWPHCPESYLLASRHYAFEGRTFVLAAAMFLTKADLPADLELSSDFAAGPDVLLDGGSAIIGPDGRFLVAPVQGREDLLLADLDLERIREEKLALDVAGHYSRPDLFDVRVRRTALVPFRMDDGDGD